MKPKLSEFVDLTIDYGQGGKKSLSKALLAGVCVDNLTEFQIYQKYVEKFELTHSQYNISALKRFSSAHQKLIQQSDYKLSSPDAEPNFFSFYSHSDVNRLARLLPSLHSSVYSADNDYFIVIYWCDQLDKYKKLEYFHDFRCLSPEAPVQTNGKGIFFVVTSQHNLYKLKNAPSETLLSPMDSLWYPSSNCPRLPYFADSKIYQYISERGFGGMLHELLSDQGVTVDSDLLSPIKTLDDLMLAESNLASSLSSQVKLLIICTFGRVQVSSAPTKHLRLNRLKAKSRTNRLAPFSPGNSYFSTLFCVGGHRRKFAHQLTQAEIEKNVMVICLYGGGQMAARLSGQYVHHIIKSIVQPVHHDKNTNIDVEVIDLAKKVNKQQQQQQQHSESEEIDFDDDDDDNDVDYVEPSGKPPEFKKKCSCPECGTSTKYNDNMSSFGPEQLTTFQYSISDLLKLLGQDSPANLAILNQMLDMSVASMDIESMTVPLDVDKPNTCAFNYQTIEPTVSVQDHALFVQKPIMICHMDWLSRPNEGTESHVFFQAASDDEYDIYELMKNYWKAVKVRKETLTKMKHDLAEPIWAVIQRYRQAHFSFHALWYKKYPLSAKSSIQDPYHVCYDSCSSSDISSTSDSNISQASSDESALSEIELEVLTNRYKETHCQMMQTMEDDYLVYNNKVILASWRRSLAGQLEEALVKLESDYCIFSFYGFVAFFFLYQFCFSKVFFLFCFNNYFLFFHFSSGYDHVLLEGFLLPYLYQEKEKPKMEKKGNKVLTIRTKNGICFRDITKLLAPGTSLDSFGRLFNLPQVKAHFPFSFLDSVTKLNVTDLPTAPHYWIGELKVFSSHLSETEKHAQVLNVIQEAQRLYHLAECQTVGDYLQYYLRLDVEILYKASQLWRQHLKTVIAIDFLEHRKFTISSLSFLANQRSMSAHRKIGTFSVNNSQYYRLLRQGMRG